MTRHWFEDVADHLGRAYLRYSFTRGTAREVDAAVDLLGLAPGMRVLDVGCGPGRHANELGRRGIEVHGVDVSEAFLAVAAADAPAGVTYERLDARTMAFDADFDAAVSICQGAFGLSGGPAADRIDPDGVILEAMVRAVRPGGRLLLTAFNAYLQVGHLAEGNEFDADAGVHRETTEVRSEAGEVVPVDLWTTCFTPRELRLLMGRAGAVVDSITSVEPGRWPGTPPTVDSPEFLVVAHRPGGPPVP